MPQLCPGVGLVDVILAAVCVIIGVIVETVKPFSVRFFVERDPTLSYPLLEPTFPSSLLILLSYALPVVVLATLQAFSLFGQKVTHLMLQAAFFFAAALQFGFVSIFKCYVGRLRPNFFALCDYKGYYTALQAGGDSEAMKQYLNYSTLPGRIVTDSNLSDDGECKEGHHSFPSGHASWSFTGMVFLGLCLCNVLRAKNFEVGMQAVGFLAPVLLAAFIATSRIHDYWHNVDDVATGSVIGAVVAWWAYHRYIAPHVSYSSADEQCSGTHGDVECATSSTALTSSVGPTAGSLTRPAEEVPVATSSC